MPEKTPKLFISYKRKPMSMAVVAELKALIRERFPWVNVRSDDEELRTGDSIHAYMDKLTKVDYIIFVVS